MKDIVERLREGKSAGGYWREKEAADEIERLREEVKELEEIMEENKCAVGYLITKRVLKQHGMWKLKESE
jgi:hypothetical protein